MANDRERGQDRPQAWSRRYERPYATIGGQARASAHAHLAIEALVATAPWASASPAALTPERRAIVQAGRGVVSIAEVAVLLDVPLGVARILVGDMADEGLVVVHQRAEPQEPPDLDLLRRVLHGLKAI